MDSYYVDTDMVRAEYENNKEFYDTFVERFRRSRQSDFLERKYDFYGVDNDFDLIEAMWEANRQSTGDLLRESWFRKFRMKCAMNPEYTEKCLNSPAFWDMKDKILRRLKRAE